MRQFFVGVSKTAVIWIALIVGGGLAASTFGFDPGTPAKDGPLSPQQAFFVVNAAHAVVLSVIAFHSHRRGFSLAILIVVVLSMAQLFLLQMETLFFYESVQVPLDTIFKGAISVVSAGAFAGLASALLWRESIERSDIVQFSLLRIMFVAALYVGVYFTAGFFIAWAAHAVRDYYGDGAGISLGPLLGFQFLRGALWGLLAFYMIRSLSGSLITRALIVGATFSVLASAQLLYPNAFMPWDVRLTHLVEVGVSNFIFGVLATAGLSVGGSGWPNVTQG